MKLKTRFNQKIDKEKKKKKDEIENKIQLEKD